MATNLRNAQWDDDSPIPEAKLISRMRAKRNKLLAKSDWTQTPDCTISNKTEWATYRQALRDFPATWTPAETVTFPSEPS